MRPLPGDDAYRGRSRSRSINDNDITPLATRTQAPQMSYFLTDERTLESGEAQPIRVPLKHRDSLKNSTYGVESIDTTISSFSEGSGDEDGKYDRAREKFKKNLAEKLQSVGNSRSRSRKASYDLSGTTSPVRPSTTEASRPYTPISLYSAAGESIISSPGSRISDTESLNDEILSQAIVSGEEDEQNAPAMMDSCSDPQLVMPSIKMPSRRPFTEKGKNMGRLKVLIAGDSGVGKTSLIKAIVQVCEDIVHVDPLSTSLSPVSEKRRHSKNKAKSGGGNMQTTTQITEIYASTKAYPSWWSEVDESKVLRRRKSMGDSVLERNLCFVDTPGYGDKTSCLEVISPVVDYIESQFQKVESKDGMTDSDMIHLLGGNGGSQVDVVFYIIVNRIKPVDIEYLRRISSMTNVIPLIARSEVLSLEDLASVKRHVLSELQAANIRPFLFGLSFDDALQSSQPAAPYAISTMFFLMNPEYVQPLVQSELAALVDQLFEPDSIAWLRNSAAKKFVAWRNNQSMQKPQSLYRPLAQSMMSSSTSQVLTAPVGATTSYALARITDHTQREERLAQVRLSNWAIDLQRSLQNERARFETLARSERAVWLTERLGECVQDGTLVPISQARQPQWNSATGALVKRGKYSRTSSNSILNTNDPLGILEFNEDMKRRGIIALQVVSSFGIIGGLAFWINRNWQPSGASIWGLDWTGIQKFVDWR
ncbi:putative heat shock protein [Botrytis fragariae]|uniref:Putative heat shock protein n=1 Tax=Botrytis fragariae TaxID=1964551 RepID=A0A8H6ATU8_9HELO|nr:putative heat shock protein [Botrytis fragariae]KAF5873486.1 putative heat shock protein [Botrytis fragariae]